MNQIFDVMSFMVHSSVINCLTGSGHFQDHSTHLSLNPPSSAPTESLVSTIYSALPVAGTCQSSDIQLLLVCPICLVSVDTISLGPLDHRDPVF